MRRSHFVARRMMRRSAFRTMHRMHHRPLYRHRPLGYQRYGYGYGHGRMGLYGRRPIVYVGGAAGGIIFIIIMVIILIITF